MQVIVFSFEVYDLQVVALKQVVELEGVIVEHQYFGQATTKILSIGSEIASSPRVVAIGFASFSSSFVGFVGSMAIGCSIDQARVVGNFETIGIVVGYFSQYCSNWIDFVEGLWYYGFSIDYHMNLNFAREPKVYLTVEPMFGVEQ